MPDVGVQIPPNLSDWWLPLVARGRDRPRRAVGQRRPHLAGASVPEPAPGAQAAPAGGLCAHRAAVRVPAVHRPRVDGAGRARHDQAQVLVVHPAPGLRPPRATCAIGADLAPGAIERARDNQRLTREELTALFAERRPEVIEDMRLAADEIRAAAGGRHRHLRRQPEHQLHEHLPGRMRVLRVRAGKALARRLPRRARTTSRQGPRRGRLRRDRDLHAGRHPSRLHARGLRPLAAGSRRRSRPTCTCTRTRRWRSTSCASARASRPRRCSST